MAGRRSFVAHTEPRCLNLALSISKKIRVPRLGADVESAIADLMDRSVSTSAKADQLENEATKLAQEQVDIAIEKVVSNT